MSNRQKFAVDPDAMRKFLEDIDIAPTKCFAPNDNDGASAYWFFEDGYVNLFIDADCATFLTYANRATGNILCRKINGRWRAKRIRNLVMAAIGIVVPESPSDGE